MPQDLVPPVLGKQHRTGRGDPPAHPFQAGTFSCCAHEHAAPEESSVSVPLRRNQESCGEEGSQHLWEPAGEVGVLFAPGPLCAWLSAPFQPFLTLFDGLG